MVEGRSWDKEKSGGLKESGKRGVVEVRKREGEFKEMRRRGVEKEGERR